MSEPTRKPPVDKALELFVYAPLGVTLYLIDAYPMLRAMLVNRGRIAVEQRSNQVTGKLAHWKSAGEVALAFGPPEIKRRVSDSISDLKDRAADVGVPGIRRDATRADASATVAPATVTPAPSNGNGLVNGMVTSNGPGNDDGSANDVPHKAARRIAETVPSPDVSGLPIPGYDELSASQVVERLAGLESEDLDAVREYELAGRARKTILGRIEQLIP